MTMRLRTPMLPGVVGIFVGGCVDGCDYDSDGLMEAEREQVDDCGVVDLELQIIRKPLTRYYK